MMAIRRALAMVVALAVSATFAVAQQAPTKKDDRKRNKQEQQEIEQVVKLVDGVMAGQPAPTDITMSLEPFFMKSQEAAHVRAVRPDCQQRARRSGRALHPRCQSLGPARPEGEEDRYPWDDIHFIPQEKVAPTLHRVFMAPAGTYDVYIAYKERTPEKNAPRGFKPKMGVLKTRSPCPTITTAS